MISTENLKAVLFLLSWPIPVWTDCRTPNFSYPFNSSLVSGLNENKNQLGNYLTMIDYVTALVEIY